MDSKSTSKRGEQHAQRELHGWRALSVGYEYAVNGNRKRQLS